MRREPAFLLLLLAPAPAGAEGDCFFRMTKQAAVLGNSAVEIRLDPGSGVVTGLANRQTGTEFLAAGGPFEAWRLVYSTYEHHGARPEDPWSAAGGTPVRSSRQRVASMRFEKTPGGGRLQVAYERLRFEKRTVDVAVRYTIELRDDDEETLWRLSLRNDGPGVVREAHFPLVSSLVRQDALLMPNESGQRLRDPLERLSDELPVISLEYPGRGSMQWFE
jgi:hypothetical protein